MLVCTQEGVDSRRSVSLPWWLVGLQHAAHARTIHSSAMQLGLRNLPANTLRVLRQGANPARVRSRALYWPTFGTGVETSGRRSCQGSLEPPREIPVYKILKLQDVFLVHSDQLLANLRL